MTCFWNGIISALTLRDFSKFNFKKKPNPKKFVKFLKKQNVETPDILWNKNKLSDKMLKENKCGIIEHNLKSINNGYDCSCCDPYLFLVSKLFKVNIKHIFNGKKIIYKNVKAKKTLKFRSNKKHFWKF